LAIDRILDLEELSIPFKENTEINWEEYFEDIMGVTKPDGQPIQQIVMHFFGKTGRYIESKPIHGSQKSKWLDTNTLEVKLELIPNYEFERLILSYGESVKVLTPKELALMIKSRIERALSLY
jgi:predicted DNA-binding transcriptional regulator YafY